LPLCSQIGLKIVKTTTNQSIDFDIQSIDFSEKQKNQQIDL